jgi:hypothetical protein
MRRAALAALTGAETGPSAPSLARTLAAPPIARDVRGLCIVTGAAPLGDSSLDTWYHRPSRPTACAAAPPTPRHRLHRAATQPLQPPKLAKSSPPAHRFLLTVRRARLARRHMVPTLLRAAPHSSSRGVTRAPRCSAQLRTAPHPAAPATVCDQPIFFSHFFLSLFSFRMTSDKLSSLSDLCDRHEP